MQLTLSAVFAAIEAGNTKKEIREMFALSAKQYKTLVSNPAVAEKFEQVKTAKQSAIEAEKAAKRAEKDLILVDDLSEVTDVAKTATEENPSAASTFNPSFDNVPA
jgi:hypothetical protein